MTQENKNLITNYPSAKFSWLKSGGNISQLYKVHNQIELNNLFIQNDIKTKSFLVIGNLSNTLIKDEGFKGIGIKLLGDFTDVQVKSDNMLVCAAVLDNNL